MYSFVGLTPGILVCLGVSRWLSGFFGGRKGRLRGQKQGRMLRVLRLVLSVDQLPEYADVKGTGILIVF